MRREGALPACDAVPDATAGASSAGIDQGLPLPRNPEDMASVVDRSCQAVERLLRTGKVGFRRASRCRDLRLCATPFFGQAAVQPPVGVPSRVVQQPDMQPGRCPAFPQVSLSRCGRAAAPSGRQRMHETFGVAGSGSIFRRPSARRRRNPARGGFLRSGLEVRPISGPAAPCPCQAVEKPLGQAKWGFGEQAVATVPLSLNRISSVQLRFSRRLAR